MLVPGTNMGAGYISGVKTQEENGLLTHKVDNTLNYENNRNNNKKGYCKGKKKQKRRHISHIIITL